MKRTWTLLGIGLALALPLTACTRDKAPDVTPTPSPVVTSQPSTMPENTPAAPNTTTPAPDGYRTPEGRRLGRPSTRSGMPGMPPRT